MTQDSPKCWAVNAIEGVGKVNKVCIYCGWPFNTLFHDLPKSEDLIGTVSSLPEPCLLFSKKRVNCCGKPIEDYSAKNFVCNRDDNIIPLQLVRSPFLGSLKIRPVFHDKGAASDSQVSRRMSVSNVAVICSSAFSISAYIWSIAGVFPSFNGFIALLTSSTFGGSVSMFSHSGDGHS